jgi:glycosyltransferase involved in cell wall biosynthesis
MLQHLAQNHDVTLVSFIRPDDPLEAVAHLEQCCSAVYPVPMRRSAWRNLRAGIKGLLTGLPMVVVRDDVREMKETLRQLMQTEVYDVVHADQLSMAGYGQLAVSLSQAHRPRTLLDEHNAIYVLTRRMADTERRWLRRQVITREAEAFARYEAEMCRIYDALFTVIPEDQDHLLKLLPAEEQPDVASKFTVIPICVDPDEEPPVVHRQGQPPTLLALGTMFWPPNIEGVLWFAAEVLPLVRAEVPDARFVVVGKNPPKEVEALAEDPNVEVTGYVADVTPYLEAADVFVVPLHAGSGMRVKILDAWLWGLPVVTTPIGAEGIEVLDGDNILLADEPASFARATVRLLTDKGLNDKLRKHGRAWVTRRYGWQEVYKKVDEAYDLLLNGRA